MQGKRSWRFGRREADPIARPSGRPVVAWGRHRFRPLGLSMRCRQRPRSADDNTPDRDHQRSRQRQNPLAKDPGRCPRQSCWSLEPTLTFTHGDGDDQVLNHARGRRIATEFCLWARTEERCGWSRRLGWRGRGTAPGGSARSTPAERSSGRRTVEGTPIFAARMLVVGYTRGGTALELMLGSVSAACLSRAACSILVARRELHAVAQWR